MKRTPGRATPLLNSIAMYIVATLFFVALDSLAKLIIGTVNVPFVVWGRYASALLILVIASPLLGGMRIMATQHLFLQLSRGALLVGATACMFRAVATLPVAESYAISYASPLIVTLLAAAFLSERLSVLKIVSVLTGFAGVLIIIRPGLGEWRIAMLFPLGTAFFYAVYQILTRFVGHKDSAFTSLFYVTFGGAVLTSLTLPWTYVPVPASTWVVLGLMGALGTIGHFLIIKAYTGAEASVLSPFVYMQIIWAGLVDRFVFDISLDPFVVIGAAVIISSGLLILKKAKPPPQSENRNENYR